MRMLHSVCRGALLGFLLSLVFSLSFCYGDGDGDKTVEVIGVGECGDCAQSNIQTTHAFSGLRVTIDCKDAANGEFKTRGVGELDKDGKFKISLPQEIAKNEELKEQCYAQLHSASATPCPTHNGLEASKIVFKSKSDAKQTFSTAGKLKFSPVTCTSAFLWPHFKYPPLPKFPPIPKFKIHPWKKDFGHYFHFPPHKIFPPIYKKPFPPPVPIYKKPLPPPVPVYEKPLPPPVPVYEKPLPPPVPIYKKPLPPPVPIYKPKPKPPVPVYKKPLPPPVPIYKPKPKPPVPVYKKPLPPPVPIYKKPLPPFPPIYKHPIYKKPLPPFPPIYKKPFPPIYKHPIYKKPFPPFPKVPTLPPKYFHHPKFGHYPPLPPFSPHSP